MTDIKITYNCEISDKTKEKMSRALMYGGIEKISEGLDITGLSEIIFSSNIKSIKESDIDCHINGEMEVLSSDPPNYRIWVYIFNNQKIDNWLNTIRHEMAHVHDRNKIISLYLFCESCGDSNDVYKKFYPLVIRTWSEFYATYRSNIYSNIDNVNAKIVFMNSVLDEIEKMEKQESTYKKQELIVFISRFIGEIISTDYSQEGNKKIISNTKHDIVIRRLYDELDCLKDSYPVWNDESVFNGLYQILVDFLCENY